jgi:anti-sigma regulatory factor (Ser/Thr protein kinase)
MRLIVEMATRFPATPAGLAEVHATFARFFQATDSCQRVQGYDRVAIVTATAEIAANIIVHACPGTPGAEIALTVARYGHSVVVRFEDPGALYGAAPPARGLTVARASMKVEYSRDGTVNRWRLERLTGLGPADD